MGLARKIGIGLGGSVLLAGAAIFALDWADRAYPPPLDGRLAVSVEVRDADDRRLLRPDDRG